MTVGNQSRYDAFRELRHSSTGEPFHVWKYVPRIPDLFLDCVVYLYPSAEMAQAGEAFGGTGFIVGLPSAIHSDVVHLYAVTNQHVICSAPIIRFNTRQGDTLIRELKPEDWTTHPDGIDLAALYLADADPARLKYSYIDNFLDEGSLYKLDIGPGDDVFTVGRFISHDGKQRNEPSVRFGNISMMPSEPMNDNRGRPHVCFLVEVRSLRGSSGSPVFVYSPALSLRPKIDLKNPLESIAGFPPMLLGVAFADVPYTEEVKEQIIENGEVVDEIATHYVAYSNSGQMAVIPAWILQKFLREDARLTMARIQADREREEKAAKSPLRPTAQEVASKGKITREEFEESLRRASQKVVSSDEEKDEDS